MSGLISQNFPFYLQVLDATCENIDRIQYSAYFEFLSFRMLEFIQL